MINILKNSIIFIALTTCSYSFGQNNEVNKEQLSAINNLAQKNNQNCEKSCYYFNNALIEETYEKNDNIYVKISFDTIITKKDILQIPILLNKWDLESISFNNEQLFTIYKENNSVFAAINKFENINKLTLTIKSKKQNSLLLEFNNIPIVETKNKNIFIDKKENSYFAQINIKNTNLKSITLDNEKQNNSSNINEEQLVDNQYIENNFVIEKIVSLTDNLKTINKIYPISSSKDEKINLSYFLDELSQENVITQITAENNKDKVLLSFFPKDKIYFETSFNNNDLKIKNTTKYLKKVIVNNDSSWFYEVVGGNNYKNHSNNVWFLFPNEELNLKIKKLIAKSGKTVVVQSIDHTSFKEQTERIHEINYQIFSSIGQEIYFKIPKKYKISSINLNNIESQYYNDKENKVFLKNGLNSLILRIKEQDTYEFIYKTPLIEIFDKDNKIISANNHEIKINSFENRFLIYAFGTDIYPSMMLIGLVIILGAISFVLSKINLSVLKFHHWFTILLGMSQVGIYAIISTIIMFLIMGKKINDEKNKIIYNKKGIYNLSQIIYASLTLLVVSAFFSAVYFGLLKNGNSYIDGLYSNKNQLYFYSYEPTLANIIWLPSYIYNGIMFLWSLFVASLLINLSIKWWQSFSYPTIFMKNEKNNTSLLNNSNDIKNNNVNKENN